MENSYDSAAKWSDSTCPYIVSWSLQSDSSDSDLSRFNLGFSSSSSVNFPADELVGGIEKADSLSRSHRLAEKRRRDRINSHLSALRKHVPNSDKLDKAALLARVIEEVKELKQKATQSPIFQELPTESDEVIVQPETISNNFESDTNSFVIFKASFCCEDQPEAISEIIRLVRKLKLETIQAEIICLGGRMRINFILKDSNCRETTSIAAATKSLKQSLCAALNRMASSSSSSSTSSVNRIRSKRQRWFLSSHYTQ